MKNFIYFFCTVMLLGTQAQSKAVKLGRNTNTTMSYYSSLNPSAGLSELAETPERKDCDANCTKCEGKTGQCQTCIKDRYLSDNLCLLCPEKTYCDGEQAIPNCTNCRDRWRKRRIRAVAVCLSGAKGYLANQDILPRPYQQAVVACN